jgi:4-diphosphocytidyl-2-C-methyl-D-erythritol kinase
VTPRARFARAPAKVNLALHVLGRLPDGYHELDTVFQAIDLWDELEIAPAEGLSLSCDDPRLPTDASNLVMRAAEMVRAHSTDPPGAAIHLRKSIPVQAGLGGGSADAAAALLLCASFWGVDRATLDLEGMARELGADVPFFLRGGTARGTGRGDRIVRLPPVRTLPLLLGCPPFGVATAEVFKRVGERLTLPGNGVNLPYPNAHKWPKENDFGFMTNDLEPVVFDGWPELQSFRNALMDVGASAALLSGSGSTVYGVFRDQARLASGLVRLRESFEQWRLLPTRTVDAAAGLVERGSATNTRGS